MPFFKTTKNIFTTPWQDELYDENWLESNEVYLPPKKKWDYKREMKIEDVDIWEQIYFQGGGLGVYVAWSPYAEFYMIVPDLYYSKNNKKEIETFYGPESGKAVYNRCLELKIPIKLNKIWVDQNDMWQYKKN